MAEPPPALPEYEPWGPQQPPGGPSGPGGTPAQQWRGPLLVGLVAAVVGGASVAAWMLLGAEDDRATTTHPPLPSSRTASASASPNSGPSSPTSTSTGASPSPSGSGAGPGYTVVRDDAGFSVAVPTGWEPSTNEQGNGSFYRRPGDRRALLQIFRVTEEASTGSCELLRMSSDRLNTGTPGYREVSLESVAGTACELVYEYDSAESHGRRRGIERIITASDGKRWALLAAGPAADGTTTRANLAAALDSFRPG
ncbi:hypothetical protein [Streptomyces sp. NPDC059874]|uniref:hypothetical protein n=1 Tax=Streptomyces sp. NPDC059874 TaxID=3346983 RepID=UPI00365ABC45